MPKSQLAKERAVWTQIEMKAYRDFLAEMEKSIYYYSDGQIHSKTPKEQATRHELIVLDFLQNYHEHAKQSPGNYSGIKVLPCDNGDTIEIYYEFVTPSPTTNGPAYNQKISIDKSTGEIIHVLGG